MTLIPVDPSQYPTALEPLPESGIYKVELKEFAESPKPDKNGNTYLFTEMEVVEPEEWKGRKIVDNYVGIPTPITEDMDAGERRRALESGIKFAQICGCFGITAGPDGVDISSAIGNQGEVEIYNEEYQGRKFSRIKNYLLQKSA